MAPAIAHFLVGASLLLVCAVPLTLRYDLDRENAIWLVLIGGVWGIAPDAHNIVPVFRTQLHVLHYSPWMDLFAFHHTLDRPFVRSRYLESIFVSIVLFSVAVTTFWWSGRIRRRARDTFEPRRAGRVRLAVVVTVIAAIYGSGALFAAVSIQDAFGALAPVFGSTSELFGALVVLPLGISLGTPFGLGVWVLLSPEQWSSVRMTTGLCIGLGVIMWLVCIVFLLPFWLHSVADIAISVPFVHLGSLLGLCAYGAVFGCVYGLLYGVVYKDRRQLV